MNSKLRHLKNKFLAWSIKWANMDDYAEEIPFDLPEVVNILQALGFQIRDASNLDVKDLSLRNGEKGIKVVLTCVHSGQICHLEKPTEDKSCKCIAISDDNARDGFWEVSTTKPSNNQSGTILETGSDLIPQLSKEMVLLVNGITNQVFKIMKNENYLDLTQSLNKSFLGSPGKSLSKSFDLPSFMVSSPGLKSDKPIRYGSLDAIPGTYSSSNNMICKQLNISRTELVSESYQIEACSTKDFQSDNEWLQLQECYPLIERAHCDLSKVIERMRKCNFEDTSCIYESAVNETTDSIITKSTSEPHTQNQATAVPSKLVLKSKSGVSMAKPLNITPRASSSPSMTGISSKLKKPQGRFSAKFETPKEKLQENVKMAKLTPTLKAKDTPTRSSKYAHVKSTIPKPAPLKKK